MVNEIVELHWCQCDPCTQERINTYKRIAELEKEQAAWRKFTNEANRTLDAADKKIAEQQQTIDRKDERIAELEAKVERLEKVMRELADGSHDTFPDASYLQCKHQRYGYEGCTICYDEALEAALEGGE